LHFFGKKVSDLSLAFVSPLGTDDDGRWHGTTLFQLLPLPGNVIG
jgi:hypothetical protein